MSDGSGSNDLGKQSQNKWANLTPGANYPVENAALTNKTASGAQSTEVASKPTMFGGSQSGRSSLADLQTGKAILGSLKDQAGSTSASPQVIMGLTAAAGTVGQALALAQQQALAASQAPSAPGPGGSSSSAADDSNAEVVASPPANHSK